MLLHNRELSIRGRDGVDRQKLERDEELLAALARYFGVRLPPGTEFLATKASSIERFADHLAGGPPRALLR